MALHPDITRKDDVSLALETAAGAILLATRQQTSNAGSVTIQNSDGSKTLMGVDAGDATVARFVGRVTPPNRPTGIQAESHMGTLFVAWDGTLDGGMDAAFLFTRITISYADVNGDHSVDLGDLRGKGSVGSTTLPAGTVVTVTARAYDDAHDETGRSMPNVSAPSDPITVTIVDEAAQLEADVTADIKVVSDKADKAQAAADKANDANTQLRSDVSARLDVVDDTVSGVRTDVDKATAAAAKNANDIDAANTKIVQTNTRVDGVSTTISNVSSNADSALSLSTQNHQDLTGFQTTVSNTYSTKQDTLSQVSAVSKKADSISATLSKDYQKKTDADATYATKTALQATADGINASVSETYATKSVVDALKNIADNAIETWQGHGVPSMTGEPTSEWTTGELRKQHSGDMYYDLDTGYSYRFGSADGSTYAWSKIADSDITKAMQAAAAAQSTADKNTDAVSKLNTDIPATYATKSDVKITTDGIKTDVSKAMTLGQTGIDNAATVDHKADGIQATVTQQAQTLSDNVKAIAQVNMRADSLSTSITQVSNKTDQALANAQELVRNGNFEAGDANWSGSNSNNGIVHDTAHSGMYSWAKQGDNSTYLELDQQLYAPIIPGHTYRFSVWARIDQYAYVVGGNRSIYATKSGSNEIDSEIFQSSQPSQTWFEYVQDWTAPADAVSFAKLRYSFVSSTSTIWLDDVSLKDVTEAITAQQSADAASSKADTAISQSSQLSQDLSGFKTSVGQTYETKSDSTSKATTAQQNLDGFKQTVQATYLDKTNASNTYSTKAEVKATTDQISSNLTAVGTTANSAMTKVTDAQQNLDGFKNSVSTTYATKSALDSTNGNVSNAQNAANQALANAQELIVNGGFKSGNIGPWYVNATYQVVDDMASAHSGRYYLNAGSATEIAQPISVPVAPGHTYRFSGWYRRPSTNSSIIGGIRFQKSADGTTYSDWLITDFGQSKQDHWTYFSIDGTIPSDGRVKYARYRLAFADTTGVVQHFDDLSFKDITEVAQLQSDVAATYATQSSVQQTATQITSQVAATYATQQDVTSKYTTLQQTDSAFDARIGTAQSHVETIETLIHSDANGVRVGKTLNGSYTGYSALINANGSFDVLNPNSDAIARFNSDNLAYRYGDKWYSVVSGFKHVATASDLPTTSVEHDRCIVDDVRREKVYQNGVWKNRSMLVTRYYFGNAGTNPPGHVFMSVYYDFPTGMVTCIVDWDREITHLIAGNNTWTFGKGYPKALMPSHILDDANNFQMIVASSQASIVTIRNTGEVQLSTQRWNTTSMSHIYSGPATFPAAGGAWMIPGQDF